MAVCMQLAHACSDAQAARKAGHTCASPTAACSVQRPDRKTTAALAEVLLDIAVDVNRGIRTGLVSSSPNFMQRVKRFSHSDQHCCGPPGHSRSSFNWILPMGQCPCFVLPVRAGLEGPAVVE